MRTMAFVQRVFPYGFRKMATAQSTPRVRFEAIAVGSYLAMEARPSLVRDAVDVMDWLEGDAFQAVTTSDAANVRGKLYRRLEFVRDALLHG